jgi:ABC-type multidrug transport system fused ATPase/permease subunit
MRKRTVCLDEASSPLDQISDQEMQRALRNAFGQQVTILTIAHRVQTIIDYDKISKFFTA